MSHTTVIHSLAPIAPEHLNVVAQDLDTAEKRKRFEESATELMKDPMFRASAAEEIKHLRQTIRELKATFAIVRGDLWNFDSQSFVDEKGRPLRLLDEWVKYEQEFIELVNRSQSIATNAAMVLDDITSNILDHKDKKSSVEDVLDALDEAAARIPDEQEAAGSLTVGFHNLATAIFAYANRIETTAQAAHKGQQPIIGFLKQQLSEAVISLKEAQEKIRSLVAATALSSVLSGRMLTLACILCPAVFVPAFANLMGTAQSGTQLTKTRKVEKEQQLAVDDLAKRLKREEAKLDWIKNYLGRMMQTRDTIGGIATKLTAVSHIWLLLQQDLVALTQHIKLLIPQPERRDKIKFNNIWDKRIAGFRTTSETLIPLLHACARSHDV